jgi:hypothetical protein
MRVNEMRLKRVWGLVIPAVLCIGCYSTIAWLQDNFVSSDFFYHRLFAFYMFWIPELDIQSQLWKIIFILPATILCAAAFVRAGFKIPIPQKINYTITAGAVLIVAALITIVSVEFVFHETELTDDENTYDFQAQTLLMHRFVNPPPPVKDNFKNIFIINDERVWVGKYTLGHPVVVAIGMALGNRYALSIFISIVTLFLVYLIAQELYQDKKLALLALCLGAVSPFFYLISSSRLSHTTSAFFLALFMYLFLRARHREKGNRLVIYSLLAGLCLGYAFNTRSLTAFGFSLPFIWLMIKDIAKSPLKGLNIVIPLITGFSIIFACTLWYNTLITGNPLQFPFNYYSPLEAVGFGSYGHTPVLALRNLIVSIFRLNAVLFGLPISLFFLFVFLFGEKDFADRLLLGIICSMVVVYSFYYSPGISNLGPLYYYELVIPLLLLSARGIFLLKEKFAARFENGNQYVFAFLLFSCIFALTTFVPERITQISRLTKEIREPYEAVRSAGIHNALVMIKQFEHKGWFLGNRNSSPALNDDILYCRYADSLSNRSLVNYFSERKPYVLCTDTINERFEVIPIDKVTLQPLPPDSSTTIYEYLLNN